MHARPGAPRRLGPTRPILGTSQDISERKRAAAELARNTALLQAILQSIPDALYVGDATGIKQANTPALEMLGFPPWRSSTRTSRS